ncbi:PepSY domain-containing protein [Caulobacter sp. RHG1]|uniref:PepSY-associated TM helix domain-containing protein n=1 Tax=Caulobacter sp. (strain RHG1) TaxID=2545762 RepID=UPI001557BEF1|nr:PepSY-associated TM helix domain-containing protein [Caulobacter sp. RHG1]NQE63745.1 putative iron-regulated membrane protein, Iron-uptake factor PiuB [Caulobacter sp. RHG1]
MASKFRWIIFQAHWLLGITLGVVLGLMGVTGATMAFEDQIMETLSPGVVQVAVRAEPVLTPDQLLARFAVQAPEAKPTSLTLRDKAGASAQVTFTSPDAPKAQKLYLDPYSGVVLGKATGEPFFATVRRLHRWLLLPGDGEGMGRQITGAAAISLIFFAISGLYLRWPKRLLDWKVWLKPNLKLKKRGLYWSLHAVAGTWVFLIYLTIAMTGLTWSYGWYKAGFETVMTGKTEAAAAPAKKAGAKKAKAVEPLTLDLAWRAAQGAEPGATQTIITLPKSAAEAVRIRVLPKGAAHERAWDELKVSAAGVVTANVRYAEKSLGEKIMSARLAVHRGSFFGLPGAILFMLAALSMPLFPITGYLLYLGRRSAAQARRRKQALAAA